MSGILTSLFETRLHPSATGGWDTIFGAGGSTPAGVEVTTENAENSAVVYACVRVLAESMACLSLITYERLDRGRRRAVEHPVYRLTQISPNPEMTPFELSEWTMRNLAIYGNAIMEIERDNASRPIALWPIHTQRVERLERVNGRLRYRVRLVDDTAVYLDQGNVLHIRGMGNGLWGDSPIRVQMNSVGLDLATEEFGSRFFANGARPGLVIKHPAALSDEKYEKLASSWRRNHEGLSNAHRIQILEEGMDISTISIPPEEAQFVETRRFQRSVIAGWYRVPPHLIGDLERATFSNIADQNENLSKYTLLPWARRIEQGYMRALMAGDSDRYYIEHLFDSLLRANPIDRAQAYAIGIQNGYLNRNEVRERENMNPFEGGDDYLVPLNMIEAGSVPETDDEQRSTCSCGRQHGQHAHAIERRAENDDALRDDRQALARANRRLFEDAAGRLVRREVADLRRALRSKGVEGFAAWLDEFYSEFRDVIPGYFEAVLLAVAEQVANAVGAELGEDAPDVDAEFVAGFMDTYASGYVGSHNRQLAALLSEADDDDMAAELVSERLNGWEETQPGKEAANLSFESVNALAVVGYTALGVQYLRWRSSGESCDFCSGLDGKIVGIRTFFVMGGESLSDGQGGSMLVRRNKRYGPLHRGCDCIVVAG